MPSGDLIANTGTLDGEAAIKGDTAVYKSRKFGVCEITIKFVKPGTITVEQDGMDSDCASPQRHGKRNLHEGQQSKPSFGN